MRDGVVRVGGDARQRFHDSRGYGRPLGGNEIALARVEAAHLLFRGDLAAVDGAGFGEFLAAADDPGFAVRFLVYADLRERGFYLSPAREHWVPEPGEADFHVYARGSGPDDGDVAYRVRALGERESVAAADLGDCVLAVVDEESEVSYFDTGRPEITGSSGVDLPEGVPAALLSDRVVCWTPPAALHERGFYGQPLSGREEDRDAVQLSLVEAAYLAARGALAVARDAVAERGRAVEGDRFDRRLRAYADLRERGVVPKTGFKFGADFRTYADVETVDDLGHSERLVRVLSPDHEFAPRDLALDVRLAGGVRKTMTFGLVGEGADDDAAPAGGDAVRWLSVERLTP